MTNKFNASGTNLKSLLHLCPPPPKGRWRSKEGKERKLGWVFYIFVFKISFLIYELISFSNFN